MKTRFVTVLICLATLAYSQESGDSWNEILDQGSGKVVFYWFPNNMEIEKSKDVMDGIEHELGMDMVQYLESKYDVSIGVQWIRANGFSEVMDIVTNASNGTFGVSSISVTKERQEVMNFSPSYFPDIAVLASSGNIPIARSPNQLKNALNDKIAVTIENTTLEMGLLKLKDSLNLSFEIEYVGNGGAIIERIEELENGFGYADLPNFLSALPRSPNIKRQVFYPLKLAGLGMVYPQNSDWKEPIEEYFASERYEEKRTVLIGQFMGENVNDLIERISQAAEIGPIQEIAILTEEVELRYKEQLEAALEAQGAQRIRNILFFGIGFFILLVGFLYYRSRLKTRTNQALAEKQNEIEQRNRELFKLNKDKNDLIKVLAHDLRAPIAKILGFTSLVKEGENLNPEQIEMLGTVERSSDELREMITKILDVESIESGKMDIQTLQLNANEILRKAIDTFQMTADQKKISLSQEISEPDLIVRADKFYLPKIIENLISNALKFSQSGTTIRLSCQAQNKKVVFVVSDEGPGFSAEDKEKVFKKYQHLSAKPTAGEPSTGLGLSIIKSYTELMGGEIQFESDLGKGTTFYVKLPKA